MSLASRFFLVSFPQNSEVSERTTNEELKATEVSGEERNKLCSDCKTEHEKVAIFANETVPRIHVVTNSSLQESRKLMLSVKHQQVKDRMSSEAWLGNLLGTNKVHDFMFPFAWYRAVAQYDTENGACE